MNFKVRDLIPFLRARGWYYKNSEGDHHHYIHPTLKGKVTVVGAGNQGIAEGTLSSILRQARATKKELREWLNR